MTSDKDRYTPLFGNDVTRSPNDVKRLVADGILGPAIPTFAISYTTT